MSPTRKKLEKYLRGLTVNGKVADVGGTVFPINTRINKDSKIESTIFDIKKHKPRKGTADVVHDMCYPLTLLEHYQQYDWVFCLETTQFFFDPAMAFRNFAFLIKPNGKLLTSFHLTHPPMKGSDYIRYTEKGIRKLLDETGFTIDEFLEPLPGYFLVQCSRSQ